MTPIPCPYCEGETRRYTALDGKASWMCLACRRVSRFLGNGAPLVAMPSVGVRA